MSLVKRSCFFSGAISTPQSGPTAPSENGSSEGSFKRRLSFTGKFFASLEIANRPASANLGLALTNFTGFDLITALVTIGTGLASFCHVRSEYRLNKVPVL